MLLVLAGPFSSACVTMQPPDGFLVLSRGPGELKATTPDDDRLWVRDFDDEARGDLAFWRDALKADFARNRGYTLLSERDVVDAGGTPGVELVWEATLGGRPFRELVAVFVREGLLGNTIRVVEFVAEKDRFDAQVEAVRGSIATLR